MRVPEVAKDSRRLSASKIAARVFDSAHTPARPPVPWVAWRGVQKFSQPPSSSR